MSDGAEKTQDAVVLVPGIMGSRLRLRESGEVLWGLDLAWYAGAWFRNRPWRDLAVTEAERAGQTDRIVADRLLDVEAMSPAFGGFLPYTLTEARLKTVLADDAAYLAFPYDWRLSVTHNAKLLADAVQRHLAAWRAHPKAVEATKRRPDQREPQVVLVAHSMGGLVCRAMCAIPGATDGVRAVLTLGTPFRGAAQAALILATGRDTPFPLPRQRLRRMARTLPGLHDLLPVYRSVAEGSEVRRLTDADVAALSGDPELARESRERHAALAGVSMPNHQAYVGGFQPTPSTLRFDSGEVTGFEHSYLVNADGTLVNDEATGTPREVVRFGDGTVPLASALPDAGQAAVTVSQQHGSMARVEEALSQATALLLAETTTLVHLGDTELGLAVPDLAEVQQVVTATLSGDHAPSASCTVYDDQGHDIDHPPVKLKAGRRVVDLTFPRPGVFRVQVQAGGGGPVTQLVLAQDPTFGEPDDEPGDD